MENNIISRIADMSYTINRIRDEAHVNATNKGFWDEPQSFGESIALIHSELSEALEDYRDGKPIKELSFEDNGKPIGIPSELADAIIRICDLAGYHEIDLDLAIRLKMEYNRSRSKMHGKIL